MREIKFRGINKDSHFVIGNVVYNFCYDDMDIVECAICFENDWVPVKIETIGQYTGLKDRRGIEIYEGDKIGIKNCNGEIIYIGEVNWSSEYLSYVLGEDFLADFSNGELIIRGNIYENRRK